MWGLAAHSVRSIGLLFELSQTTSAVTVYDYIRYEAAVSLQPAKQ